MNFVLPWKVEKPLTRWVNVTFSRRILLHGVIKLVVIKVYDICLLLHWERERERERERKSLFHNVDDKLWLFGDEVTFRQSDWLCAVWRIIRPCHSCSLSLTTIVKYTETEFCFWNVVKLSDSDSGRTYSPHRKWESGRPMNRVCWRPEIGYELVQSKHATAMWAALLLRYHKSSMHKAIYVISCWFPGNCMCLTNKTIYLVFTKLIATQRHGGRK
jgi:hypothetical protein